jgi:imidazolonepropionase-like amidohydrolase
MHARYRSLGFVATAALFILNACSGDPSSELTITHVNVIPMTSEDLVLEDQDVVIRDGRIVAVRAADTSEQSGGQTIDGRGKWLIPGLVDAHMHALALPDVSTSDWYLPYLANGVLQVVNMQAPPEGVAQRAELENGEALGPHLMVARMVDGNPPIWPDSIAAATPEEGRAAVRRIKAEGYDFVKVYSALDLQTFTAILAEARQQDIRVVGHLPLRNQAMTEQLLQPGFEMVSHAEEYSYQGPDHSDATIERFAALAKANGTALTATLTANEQILAHARDPSAVRQRPELVYLPPLGRTIWLENNRYDRLATPERIARLADTVDFNKRLVRTFSAAGITLLAGTDGGIPGVMPGFALHDELESLVDAGLSNWQALAAATVTPARWLGIGQDRGTIEGRKVADLVLLDANPLDDIANSRRIAAVILGGRYLSKAELDRRMEALAVRFSANLN